MRTTKFRAYHPKLKKMIEIDLNQRGCSRLKMLRIEVSPTIELMEFTGLFDKHGKEIWEGDILTDGQNTGLVEYSGGMFGLKIGLYLIHLSGHHEVLGNAHSNPELLEAK